MLPVRVLCKRSEIVMAVNMNIAALWDVTRCRLVQRYLYNRLHDVTYQKAGLQMHNCHRCFNARDTLSLDTDYCGQLRGTGG
jgi:hypothetical protein